MRPDLGDQGPHSSGAFVYAVGRLEARFTTLSVEKEFAQASGRAETADLRDAHTVQSVLLQPDNRYLARQLCFVFLIDSVEAYVIRPTDEFQLQDLVAALGRESDVTDLQVVVGTRGPVAPSNACNGLSLPFLDLQQIYLLSPSTIPANLPRKSSVADSDFRVKAIECVDQLLQLVANSGAGDEPRAINYLVARYPELYTRAIDAAFANCVLSGVQTRISRLAGARSIVSVIFSFTSSETAVLSKLFARVDVTEIFPFLVSPLSFYFDR